MLTAPRSSLSTDSVRLNHDMDDDYPRFLVDRDVLVVHGDERRHVRLRAWLDADDGPPPRHRLDLFLGDGRYTATGVDLWEALVRLRRQLEPDGWMVAVQGSRRDTYPSGMARDMGGGQLVYVLRLGHRVTPRDDLVDTLADAAVDQLATIAEQEAHHRAWVAERMSQPRSAD